MKKQLIYGWFVVQMDVKNAIYINDLDEKYSFLSNYFQCSFAEGDIVFNSCYQYMVYAKCTLFDDSNSKLLKQILDEKVRFTLEKYDKTIDKLDKYDESLWIQFRCETLERANTLKFVQNRKLARKLLETNDAMLYDVTTDDDVWCISDPSKEIQSGLNLSGICIMNVRRVLAKSGSKIKQLDFDPTDLTKSQIDAMTYSYKKSKIFSRNMRLMLESKFYSKGYDIDDLDKIVDYMKNDVRIVIHFRCSLMSTLIDEGRYKSLHEVGKGYGSLDGHNTAESNMFNSFYKDANAREKVKYGSINMLNNMKKGVHSAIGYGNSFLILKQKEKKRTTFVHGDSYSMQQHIQTFDNCNNVLYYLPDDLTAELVKMVRGESYNDYLSFAYIECQIHGDILLDRDVEGIVCPNLIDKLRFTQKFLKGK